MYMYCIHQTKRCNQLGIWNSIFLALSTLACLEDIHPHIHDLSGRTVCIFGFLLTRTGRTEHSPPCTHVRHCIRSSRASDSMLPCPHFPSARTWSPPCIQLGVPRTWPRGTGPCSDPPLHHSAIHRPTHHKGASDSPLHPWLSPLWTHVRKSTLPEAGATLHFITARFTDQHTTRVLRTALCILGFRLCGLIFVRAPCEGGASRLGARWGALDRFTLSVLTSFR